MTDSACPLGAQLPADPAPTGFNYKNGGYPVLNRGYSQWTYTDAEIVESGVVAGDASPTDSANSSSLSQCFRYSQKIAQLLGLIAQSITITHRQLQRQLVSLPPYQELNALYGTWLSSGLSRFTTSTAGQATTAIACTIKKVDVETWQDGHGLLTMQKIISMRTSTIHTSCWGVIKYSGARVFVFDFA